MEAGFLQEATGVKSSTRFIFVAGMIWAMLFTTFMAIFMRWTPGEIIAVFAGTSGVFVGLKLGQKPMEKKEEIKSTEP